MTGDNFHIDICMCICILNTEIEFVIIIFAKRKNLLFFNIRDWYVNYKFERKKFTLGKILPEQLES